MALPNALAAKLEAVQAEYRVAPHNIDAEQALIGALLVNNDAYYRVSDFLVPEHFMEEVHRKIFEVAASLIKAGKLLGSATALAEVLGIQPRSLRAKTDADRGVSCEELRAVATALDARAAAMIEHAAKLRAEAEQ